MSHTLPGMATQRAPLRILVIDDEPVVGLSCKRSLAPEGHDVLYCEDPNEGLQAAMSGEFDIILVDLMMPMIDGFEILRRVKAAGVSAEVIIITGHSTVESAVEAMKQGAADFLSKPFSPNQLHVVVGKVWERSVLLRENAALRRELDVARGVAQPLGERAEEHAVIVDDRELDGHRVPSGSVLPRAVPRGAGTRQWMSIRMPPPSIASR